MKLKQIGVKLTSPMTKRKLLHKYLSIAFGVKLNDKDELSVLKDAKYVLTKDFTLKMLNIHERKECGMPVIIEGETGVGKTFLVEMLSKLWNESWKQHINLQKSILKDRILKLIGDIDDKDKPAINSSNSIESDSLSVKEWLTVLSLKLKDNMMLHQKLRPKLQFCWYDPCLSCLELNLPAGDSENSKNQLWELFELYDNQPSPEYMADILHFIFSGELKSCFYKLNLHAAITPDKIIESFVDVLNFANAILRRHGQATDKKKSPQRYHRPTITVFLDEINTATCPGFLKEIIVDRTLNHREIPENVFIVAACNPCRGNSQLISIATEQATNQTSSESGDWFKTSYYVQPLAPSLELLKWDYGFLKGRNEGDEDEEQADEKEYVREKMRLYTNESGEWSSAAEDSTEVNAQLSCLSNLILMGQKFIRRCAAEQLQKKSKLDKELAKQYATSCVSQRDVQRVFIIYEWLINEWFKMLKQYNEDNFTLQVRATYISIGIVYYFRLDSHYREKFEKEMDDLPDIGITCKFTFSEALQEELDFMISKFELPPRIAPTQALKENIYATVVCILNHIPLIIVGPPGSSKTLSFNIVRSHLKGQNSSSDFFKNEDLFPPIDTHSYQCSRRSTSTEVESVFKAAIRRKKLLDDVGIRSCAVVLMDEAGLAEERHESLKVLHYYLDNRKFKVSFVALSNHILDAAKTNRAISLYRSPSDLVDMRKIAKTLFPKDEMNVVELFVQQFLDFYERNKAFRDAYGIRDVVHFLLYLYRRKDRLSPELVGEALERNFNGNKDILDALVESSYEKMNIDQRNAKRNKDFIVFKNSLADRPPDLSVENQIRYKLVIDSSQDESLIGMFFAFNILDRQSTNVLVCTKFPGDLDYEKINTIAALRYSAANGRVVALISCEEIQESFYDIFNQNFSSVKLQTGIKYFGNITIGAKMKMCFVDPKFQCVVFLKQSKLKDTPAPYLNRFEKYKLTHNSILEEKLMSIPQQIKEMIEAVRYEIENIVKRLKEDSCFGFCESTVDSLILSILACESYSSMKGITTLLMPTEESQNDSKLHALLKAIITNCTEERPHLFYFEIDCLTFDDDVDFIDAQLRADKVLCDTLERIDPNQIAQVVTKSFQWLRRKEGDHIDEDSDHCPEEVKLMCFCMKEWLKLCICKKLLCIMKPKALIFGDCSPYERAIYLHQQHHFSLSELIESTLEKTQRLDKVQSSENSTGSPTSMMSSKWTVKKSIYHTRSTYLVQQVLPLYCTWQDDHLNNELKEKFETFFKSRIDCICALTLASTSNDIQNKLKTFLTSEDATVFLLVIDMKSVDPEVVNHIRIMINELEYRLSNRIKTTKVLSLLLHYPLGKSSHFVYPAIFLHDWDHFYLDDIETSVKGNINMVAWLSQCCGLNSSTAFVTEKTLDYWIDENLPIISNSLSIKPEFEWPPTIKEAKDLWSIFLSEEIRAIIKERFKVYWTHDKIRSTSNNLALQCITKLSSSMIDSINEEVNQTFNDYLLYFLSLMNNHHSLNIMFSSDDSEDPSKQLFINLLSCIPLPKTVDQFIAVLHDSEKEESNYNFTCSGGELPFPFFSIIFNQLEGILDQTMNAVHKEFKTRLERKKSTSHATELTGSDVVYLFQSNQLIRSQAIRQMATKIVKEAEDSLPLKAVLSEFQKSKLLWERYLNCVILRRTNAEGSIGSHILSNYFTRKYKIDSASTCRMEKTLSALHVNLRLDGIDSYGNGVVFFIRCIDEISKLCSTDDHQEYIRHLFVSDQLDNHQDSDDEIVSSISKVIESAFTVFRHLLADGDIEKVSSFMNIYDGIITWIRAEEIIFKLKPKTINYLILISMFFKIVYFRGPTMVCDTKQDVLENLIGKFTLKDFLSSYGTFVSQKANEDLVMKLSIIANEMIRLFFGDTNFSLLLSLTSLPIPLLHLLDFLLNFYVVETRIAYFDDNDFNWFLDLYSNKCKDTKLSSVLTSYLHQILLKGSNEEKETILKICNNEYRSKMSSYFLKRQCSVNYLPIYYKNCPKIKLLSQGANYIQDFLADAYFQLTVQQLQMNKLSIPTWMCLLQKLKDFVEDATLSDGERLLRCIEREAVTSVVCVEIAAIIVRNDDLQLEEVNNGIHQINDMLNSEHLRIVIAGKLHGHGALYILRLLQAYNSPKLFCHNMLSNFDLIFQSFECLQPARMLMQHPDDDHQLPLLRPVRAIHGRKSLEIYREICSTINNIIKSQTGTEKLDKLAFKWCVRHTTVLAESEQAKRIFMMMFLVAVYDVLFKQAKTCEHLAKHIHKRLQQYLEKEYIGLMVWFTDQGYFKNHFTQSTQSFHEAENYLIKLRNENMPLLEFLIQFLAITIGSSKSNHLWLLLYTPNTIKTPFPTLYQKDAKCFYNYEALISFSSLAYINTSCLNYQSFSLMYMVNYSALAMAFIANHELQSISDFSFEFFIDNVEKMWNNQLSRVLSVNQDEKEELLNNFLFEFYKVSSCSFNENLSVSHQTELIAEYEGKMHDFFHTAWKNKQESSRYTKQCKLADTLRFLESKMLPVQFDEKTIQTSFLRKILSSTDMNNPDNPLYILYQTLLKRPIINMSGCLLPHLVYMYNFVHERWSYLLTKEEATERDLEQLLNDYLAECSVDLKDVIMTRYKELTVNYAEYAKLTGAGAFPTKVADLVTCGKKYGFLYETICRIVKEYNSFIRITEKGNGVLDLYFKHKLLRPLPLSEVTSTTCCIGESLRFEDIGDLMPVILKHLVLLPLTTYTMPKELDSTLLPNYLSEYRFHLKEIQFEITYILSQKKIVAISRDFKKDFKFLESTENQQPARARIGTITSMDLMTHYLKNHLEYMMPLPSGKKSEFINLFHSLHYNAMQKVLIGLRLLVKHLSQLLTYHTDVNEVAELSIKDFIHMCFTVCIDDDKFLQVVGIEKHSVTHMYSGIKDEQYFYICEIKTKHLYSTIDLLANWINIELYHYRNLPCSMKAELGPTVAQEIYCRIEHIRGDSKAISQRLLDLLFENESKIRQLIHQNTEMPLIEAIKHEKVGKGIHTDELLEGMQIKHYVYAIIQLKSILGDFLVSSVSSVALGSSDSSRPSETHAHQQQSVVDSQSDADHILIPELTLAEKKRMKKKAQNISDEEFVAFLQSVGLSSDIMDAISEYDITAAVLHDAIDDDEQLAELEINKAYLRLKLRVLFKRFLLGETSKIAKVFTFDRVVEFFQKHKKLSSFAKVFMELQIDGEMLWLADDETLEELGITGLKRTILKTVYEKEVKLQLNIE